MARAAAIAVAGLALTGALVWKDRAAPRVLAAARVLGFAPPRPARPPARPKGVAPVDAALRARGYHECNPPDPIGLGPWAPYRELEVGRIAIPQRGGHDAGLGFDVILHFHAHEAARKMLAQVARGVAFAGVDLGPGSGPYTRAFQSRDRVDRLLASIDAALVAHTGDARAHVRRLGLSAWSAGHGAVVEILRRAADRVHAVVLLDGLHAGWDPHGRRDGTLASLSRLPVAPLFDYARRARDGDRLLVVTCSEVDPVRYPSTRASADLLIAELALERHGAPPSSDPFPRLATANAGGAHVWSHGGADRAAHCDHLRHLARAVEEIVEPAWQTPPMDRSVPATPAPPAARGAAESGIDIGWVMGGAAEMEKENDGED